MERSDRWIITIMSTIILIGIFLYLIEKGYAGGAAALAAFGGIFYFGAMVAIWENT
jgi:hypothetical protein